MSEISPIVRTTPQELAVELLHQAPMLRTKIARSLFCSPQECDKALTETIKFMTIAASRTDAPVTPSHRVDLAWHEFILFTRSYSHFCETNFGKMIHHEPSEDRNRNSQQYVETLRLYEQLFGQPPKDYWPRANRAETRHAREMETSGDSAGMQHSASGSLTADCGNCESLS